MDTKEFDKTYNTLQNGLKKNSFNTKLFSICVTVIVLGVLVWSFMVYTSSIDNLIVTNDKGEPLTKKVLSRTAMIETYAKNTCEQAIVLINTFDRLSIKENQAKSLFYINSKDANTIFSYYFKNGTYNEVTQQGTSYSTALKDIISLDTSTLPYKVTFTGLLTLKDASVKKQWLITVQGELSLSTAQFPQNKTGYIFSNYKQTYNPIKP